MKSIVSVLLAAIFALSCCSSSNEPGDTDGSTALVDVGDVPDSPPDVQDVVEDETSPHVPGCVGDFCAASEEHTPDPALQGPFPIGVTTFDTNLKDHKGKPRKIRVDVWYPATEAARDGPFESIDLKARAPDDVKELIPGIYVPPIPTIQVRDAKMRRQDGPYPLVLFSHGAFGIRFQSVFFTAYLASHGYIVVSADHSGNTLYDMIKAGGYSLDPVIESAWDRPLDAEHLVTLMLERNEKELDFFGGTIIPDAVAMSGHSFGAYTSFVQGFDDPRIKVIVPMAPATQQMVALGYVMGEFPLPVLLMAGGMDKTLDTQKDMRDAYEELPAPKYFLEFPTGGHYTFTDICSLDLVALADEMGFGDAGDALEDGCAEYNIPVEEAHPLIRRFGIGFLNHHLRGSKESARYFAADEAQAWVDQGMIIYKTEE